MENLEELLTQIDHVSEDIRTSVTAHLMTTDGDPDLNYKPELVGYIRAQAANLFALLSVLEEDDE